MWPAPLTHSLLKRDVNKTLKSHWVKRLFGNLRRGSLSPCPAKATLTAPTTDIASSNGPASPLKHRFPERHQIDPNSKYASIRLISQFS